MVLLRDIPDEHLCAGDLGAIMLTYQPDVYEVEFVTVSGGTQAIVTLNGSDLRRVRDSDVLSVRPREV